DNFLVISTFIVQLFDIIVCKLFLFVVVVKNRRSVLCTDIRALAVQLCRVMRDKKGGEQFVIRYFGRIVNDINGFGVPCRTRCDLPVTRVSNSTSGITRYNSSYT